LRLGAGKLSPFLADFAQFDSETGSKGAHPPPYFGLEPGNAEPMEAAQRAGRLLHHSRGELVTVTVEIPLRSILDPLFVLETSPPASSRPEPEHKPGQVGIPHLDLAGIRRPDRIHEPLDDLDVVTALEDGADRFSDPDLLDRATALSRCQSALPGSGRRSSSRPSTLRFKTP
jgi:hypothetical protein